MDKELLDGLKGLKEKLEEEDRDVIDEFLQVCNVIKDMDELDEYSDLLLGIADSLDEEDQKIIYDIIDNIAGIKLLLENVIKNSLVNVVNIQLKNVTTILNSINEDIEKNNEKLKTLANDKTIINKMLENKDIINLNDLKNKSVISGILDVT